MLQQNPTESWWHWLYTNAPAAWTSAAVAIVSLLVVLRTRRRPKRIVIREISRSSLIRIWPSVRRNIRITFGGDPINTLGQIDFEIFNEGSEFIDQPALNLILPTETRILGSHAEPEEANAQCQTDKSRLTVRLPHLNPIREHRQIVFLSVLVDGPTTPLKITGGGEGWSLLRQSLPTAKQQFWYGILRTSMVLAWILLSILYSLWVEKKFGIGPWEFSWRSFYVGTPVIITMVILATLDIRSTRKKLKRPLSSWADD